MKQANDERRTADGAETLSSSARVVTVSARGWLSLFLTGRPRLSAIHRPEVRHAA
jgi:hypothetical protein